MKCLITAGPSYEPLDEVRRLTNFSTGELGCLLADKLESSNNDVTLLLGAGATFKKVSNVKNIIEFTTAETLKSILISLKEKSNFDAIFHAAAICDYRVCRVYMRSESSEMIEIKAKKIPTSCGRIFAELIPTEKIISILRPLFPGAVIVGWKYETDGNKWTTIEAGERQIKENNTDACVLNGPAYGMGFGILFKEGTLIHTANKYELVVALEDLIKRIKK